MDLQIGYLKQIYEHTRDVRASMRKGFIPPEIIEDLYSIEPLQEDPVSYHPPRIGPQYQASFIDSFIDKKK